MNITREQLQEAYAKEIEDRIQKGQVIVPKKRKWKTKKIYKNDEEYIEEKTEKWLQRVEQLWEQGKIKDIIDLLHLFKRSQRKFRIDERGSQ